MGNNVYRCVVRVCKEWPVYMQFVRGYRCGGADVGVVGRRGAGVGDGSVEGCRSGGWKCGV